MNLFHDLARDHVDRQHEADDNDPGPGSSAAAAGQKCPEGEADDGVDDVQNSRPDAEALEVAAVEGETGQDNRNRHDHGNTDDRDDEAEDRENQRKDCKGLGRARGIEARVDLLNIAIKSSVGHWSSFFKK